jgi:hypothetical protein
MVITVPNVWPHIVSLIEKTPNPPPAAAGRGRTRIDTGANVPLAWRMSAKVKAPLSLVIREFGRNTASP